MIKCPKCQATLPDGSLKCQFCGEMWAGPPAPRAGLKTKIAYTGGTPAWVWPAYFGIAGWWVVNGVWVILHTTVLASKEAGGIGAMLSLVVGGVTALIGIGLLLRVEAARGVVNFLCFLQILGGLMTLAGFFFGGAALSLWAVVALLMAFVQIGTAGLMIFLIGETDRTPNF